MTKRHGEPSEMGLALLTALVEIENRAIQQAYEGGCRCDQPYPGTDRTYPLARFDRDRSIGKPFDQIEWELLHQPGCPMDGQKGIG
jgi:hypothetical protein